MNRQRLWFIVKEGVCRERSTDVHDEVVYGTMSGVHDVGLVLNQVVDTLYDAPLSEHDFVPHEHETVLHVSPQSVHEMYAPVKEILEKCLFDVPLVSEDFAIEFLDKTVHTRLSLSSIFAPVKQNVIISPLSLHIRCNLKP